MRIISFGHRKGVGKDSACEYIKKLLNKDRETKHLRVEIRSFAKPLKHLAFQLWGWAGLQQTEYYDNNWKAKQEILPKINKSPRDLWVELGMAIRGIYADTWSDLQLMNKNCDVCLISDLRFPNEAHAIEKLKGKRIKIVRPKLYDTDDPADTALAQYKKWDRILVNDKDLQEFWKNISVFFDQGVKPYVLV